MEENINNYDCIIVAFQNGELSKDICGLIKEIITNENCTVFDYTLWHNATIPLMRADRTMSNPLYSEYKGMILGISHAEVGFLANRFQSCCNLAVSSQDLFYNFKTLQYCISKYWPKIKELQYLIIDMYDYNYFNLDTSLSENIYNYYAWGGYNLDEHNLKNNKHYTVNLHDIKSYLLMKRYEGIDDSKIDLWNELFPDTNFMNNYAEFFIYQGIEERMKTLSEEMISKFEVTSSVAKKEFTATIEENITIMKNLLKLVYETWPDIKVYLTILSYIFFMVLAIHHLCLYEMQKKCWMWNLQKMHRKNFYSLQLMALILWVDHFM